MLFVTQGPFDFERISTQCKARYGIVPDRGWPTVEFGGLEVGDGARMGTFDCTCAHSLA